jgi:hypothetical protein
VKIVRLSLLVACLFAVGCGSDSQPKPKPKPPPHKAVGLVSVGRPVTPRFTREIGPGWDELRVRSADTDGRPVLRVVAMRQPPGRPRDFCVTHGLAAQDIAEADTECDLSAPRSPGAVSFLTLAGSQDRRGRWLALVSGRAPPGVHAVRVEGVGGSHTLPLSAHRAFAAVYAGRAHGKVRLVSERSDGEIVRSFKLPLPKRGYLSAHHQYRRRGAVFGDEIGEPVASLSYRQLVRRYGPPAVVRREHGQRCAYYEVVGYANDGWQFCALPNGRLSAAGNMPPPAH